MGWQNNALIADLSRKNGILSAGDLDGFDATIVRLGGSENAPNIPPYPGYPETGFNPYFDDRFEANVQAAYTARATDGSTGIPCIASFVIGPRAFTERGVDSEDYGSVSLESHPVFSVMLRKLRAGSAWKAIHGVAFYLTDESLNMSGGYKVTNLDLKAYIEDLRERVVALKRAALFPNIPVGFFSRKSLIEAIEPDGAQNPHLKTWFENHPEFFLATANFPTTAGTAATAEAVRARFLPVDTARPGVWGYSPAREKPDAEYPLWSFWNFAAAGRPHRFALHLYNGDRTQLWHWLKFRQTTGGGNSGGGGTGTGTTGDLEKRFAAIEAEIAGLKEFKTAAGPILDRANRHTAG